MGMLSLQVTTRQLGPIYGFQMKDSVQGLFDCIFSYMKETHGITPVQLKHNYRTKVEISAWPCKRFYKNEYEAFFPERKLDLAINIDGRPADWPEQLPWSDEFLRILDPACPVVVISYSANTYTLSNPFEAQIVSALTLLYKKLVDAQQAGVSAQEFWTQKIGIVTPHRAQMASIRNLLDDYHHIHEVEIHQLLDQLLLHPPSSFHLVLSTRLDPPLSLATLRAHAKILELRPEDLRFTVGETMQLTQKIVGGSVDDGTIDH